MASKAQVLNDSGKFQFLIGRLKTDDDSGGFSDVELFQFLIGRLKTSFFPATNKEGYEFQFLIGRLKTAETDIDRLLEENVSIPHR